MRHVVFYKISITAHKIIINLADIVRKNLSYNILRNRQGAEKAGRLKRSVEVRPRNRKGGYSRAINLKEKYKAVIVNSREKLRNNSEKFNQ